MTKQAISTHDAPDALGPYSQAVMQDGWLFVSGQIGLNPQTGMMAEGGFEAQSKQVLANILAILEAAGAHSQHVVKLSVYLQNIDDFSVLNEQMQSIFVPPYPARAVVACQSLPKGALLEIDAVAFIPS
jgi:2-iminobutanoate/2-iminopropanoate deaminase